MIKYVQKNIKKKFLNKNNQKFFLTIYFIFLNLKYRNAIKLVNVKIKKIRA